MKKNYNYSEIKKNLKWFLEAGVDETISEFPRNLIDFSKKKICLLIIKKILKK